MRIRLVMIMLIAIALGFPIATRGQAPDDDATTRGWQIGRPKQRQPTRPRARRPKPSASGPIGLGFTLYRLEKGGRIVSVRPSTTYSEGDQLRIVVEPNVDGYLYVFDAENDDDPVMLYPDARLYSGDNTVRAHEAIEVPSSQHPVFKWFHFSSTPAVERLYVMVTRKPLPDVPTKDELVRYCDTYADSCPWQPAGAQWKAIQKFAGAPVHLTPTKTFGRAQTPDDQSVLTRRLTLCADDPPPSVIAMNASGAHDAALVKIDLKHE